MKKDRVSEDHYAGCLLGGAVGDALGWPVQFLPMRAIMEAFGPKGIKDYERTAEGVGAITDDTQMTLFTTEGLLNAHSAAKWGDNDDFVVHVHLAYLRWLATQDELPANLQHVVRNLDGLMDVQELYSRRAPSQTCLTALRSGSMGTIQNPLNDSKGRCGVTRVAPVGLFLAAVSDGTADQCAVADAFRLGVNLAAITHGHPSGYLSAGTFAAIIFGLAKGWSLIESIHQATANLVQWEGHEECLALLDLAVILWETHEEPAPETVGILGRGWTGEEALAISLFCALKAGKDFRKGVLSAINHDGDSNSTGSLTGSLLGLLLGRDAIPSRWLQKLELKDVIERSGLQLTEQLGAWGEVGTAW